MSYPDELLDRFDKAVGKVSAAALSLRTCAGKPEEGEASLELKKVRAEYQAVNKELDDFDA